MRPRPGCRFRCVLARDEHRWTRRGGNASSGSSTRPSNGRNKTVASLFNLTRIETPGGLDSLWKTHFQLGNPLEPFRTTAGPVFRMIVDLAKPARGLWVSDTGNSGWPGSPHYHDQYARWRKGGYFPMISDWEAVKKSAKGVLTLKPRRPGRR